MNNNNRFYPRLARAHMMDGSIREGWFVYGFADGPFKGDIKVFLRKQILLFTQPFMILLLLGVKSFHCSIYKKLIQRYLNV